MDDENTVEILLQHINRKNIRVAGLINKFAQLIILLYNILAIMLLMHSFMLKIIKKIMPLKIMLNVYITYVSMVHMEDI